MSWKWYPWSLRRRLLGPSTACCRVQVLQLSSLFLDEKREVTEQEPVALNWQVSWVLLLAEFLLCFCTFTQSIFDCIWWGMNFKGNYQGGSRRINLALFTVSAYKPTWFIELIKFTVKIFSCCKFQNTKNIVISHQLLFTITPTLIYISRSSPSLSLLKKKWISQNIFIT